MVISAYQINNVLRVYGDQLRQGKISAKPKSTFTRAPDKINISTEAKRQAIIDKVSSNIVDRITHYGPHESVEKEVFEKLESEYGKHLTVTRDGSMGLVFKELDESGETINSLSVEDSEILSHKLKEITKKTVNENLF